MLKLMTAEACPQSRQDALQSLQKTLVTMFEPGIFVAGHTIDGDGVQ